MMTQEVEISKLSPHPWEKSLFGKDENDSYHVLKDDIEERGLMTPIHITSDKPIGNVKPNTIICGHRRVRIFKELGKEKIPAIVLEDLKTETDVKKQFLSDNILRRKLDKVERVLVFQKLIEVETERAKERMLNANPSGKTPMEKLPQGQETGAARDLAAKRLGVSGRTMEDEAKIYEWIKDDTESIEEWRTGEVSSSEFLIGMQEYKERKKREAESKTPKK